MFARNGRLPRLILIALSLTGLNACGGGGSSSPTSSAGNIQSYNVNVTVTGVLGSGLVLQNNLSDNLDVSSDGTYQFSQPIQSDGSYSVLVANQPSSPSQTCSVANGNGVVVGADISNITISCITNNYTVGGTISGLTGSVVLKNNAGDIKTVTADGTFAFDVALPDLSSYSVSVVTHPLGQLCSVSNGSGALGGADVNNVVVVCSTAYTVGGVVSGLTSQGLVLQNNGGDNLNITGDGAFTFTTPLPDTTAYSVTVLSSPLGPKQDCVIGNGTGSVQAANVSNISVTCTIASKHSAGVFYSSHFGLSRGFGVALGDIDRDGDVDAIIAQSLSTSGLPNEVWLNDGTGVGNIFGSSPAYTLGMEESRTVQLVDVDGDLDLDLLVGNKGANSVWINQGGVQAGVEGVYVDSGQALGNTHTSTLAIGDVDNDGVLDFVAGSYNNVHEVWINDGAGGFGLSPVQSFGDSASISRAVSLADMDGDGDLDLVESEETAEGLIVWFNQGLAQGGTIGTFSQSAQVMAADITRAVDLGDVDGDGDIDVVTGHFNATKLWLNDGSGSLTNSAETFDATDIAVVKLFDYDGDGDLDLMAASDWEEPHKLWLNQNGSFTDSGAVFTSGTNTHDIAVADIDGDGDLDMVEGYYDGALMWLNDGAGGVVDPIQHLYTVLGSWTSDVDLADIDLDGDLDLIDAGNDSGNSASNYIWLNDGSGNLGDTASQSLGREDTESIGVGDFNGDGYPDLVEINSRGMNKVRLNNRDGTFAQYPKSFGSSTAWSQTVSVGDVDGDGDLDAIEGFQGGGNTIWLNDGSGNLTDSGQLLDASWTYSIAMGDVDGDGDLDMVFAEYPTDDGLWINQGGAQGGIEGTFQQSSQILGANYVTTTVNMGDLDGDGDLDLVFGYATHPTSSMAIWLNQGGSQGGTEGVFVDTGVSFGVNAIHTIKLGDVDDDGDLDIGAVSNPNTLWLNQGGDQGGVIGTFVDSGLTFGSPNRNTMNIALGDLDGDGDLDLVEGFDQANRIYENMTYWP